MPGRIVNKHDGIDTVVKDGFFCANASIRPLREAKTWRGGMGLFQGT
jgi:hypothetical protein